MKRLLVVEDSDDDFDAVAIAVESSPIPSTLVRATDAEIAMSTLLAEGAHAFDLILLDNNLPGMSGQEMVQLMRSEPRLAHIPTVVLTTSANPRECIACYRAGANAYHVKTLAFSEWRQILGQILEYWLRWTQLPVNDGRSM